MPSHTRSCLLLVALAAVCGPSAEGLRSPDNSVEVTRTFRSIVDGSPFELPPESDSDTAFYGRVRERIPPPEPIGRMITAHNHDAAVVFPPHAPFCPRTVMARGIEEQERASMLVAEISRRGWGWHLARSVRRRFTPLAPEQTVQNSPKPA